MVLCAVAAGCGPAGGPVAPPAAHGTTAPAASGGSGAPGAPGGGTRAPGDARASARTPAPGCRTPEASLPPSRADGPAVAAIKKRGKLVVGVDQNSYRWGYRNPATRKLEGFDIDLARAIATDLLGDARKLVLRAVPTDQRIPALSDGTVDLVVRTMTINCARIKKVAFSTAYFQTGQQVLAPKDSEVTGFNRTLTRKRICTAETSTAYDAVKDNPFGAIYQDADDGGPGDRDRITVPNQLDCLVRLQLGEVDAVVTDSALAAGQAAQDPAVELKGKPFTTEYYGVGVKLGHDDLVRRVNQVLVEYRKGPWLTAYDKWLKAGLPGLTGPPAPKYRSR
ncbi:glutamate ABC transporter substrate-binding protein [Streptomyces sp. LP05-1]|uniref:Glutamate ABC transporter substrate-binding protein n=1 Tax=Streptomyces pyxinae TaxID=2970734 RepID=A0ABT2CMD2_9ACTN|nr:glutamate ABC transporter substrate-binding protein [Streptomyces sp. LP05-1]MCS0638588.1 glutamate ABC transporter substrate-binding protein [Streptomyces sp. LP05-1]